VIGMVQEVSSVCLVRRSAGVRPEVRFRPVRFLGWAMTPASRRGCHMCAYIRVTRI